MGHSCPKERRDSQLRHSVKSPGEEKLAYALQRFLCEYANVGEILSQYEYELPRSCARNYVFLLQLQKAL
jgi:hypothetical protein